MLIYVALETLEYLKKGGRISGAQAAIGTLLSVKPIIKVKDGVVETADRVRTRAKARERLIELITRAADRAARDPAHGRPDVEAFRDEMLSAAPGPGPGDGHVRARRARRSGRTSVRAASACVAILYRAGTRTGIATRLRQPCARYHRLAPPDSAILGRR